MKFKQLFLSLSLAGLGLSQATAQDPASRHIGDGAHLQISNSLRSVMADPSALKTEHVRKVSDSNASIASQMAASFAGGSRKLSDTKSSNVRASGSRKVSDLKGVPAQPVSSRNVSDMSVDYATAMDASLLAPTAASFASACDGSCGGGCASCDTGGIVSGGCNNFADACASGCMGSGQLWVSGELLLWFTDSIGAPPLVTTADQPIFPRYGDQDVNVAFGGPDGIDTGLNAGFRVEAGLWLGDCEKVGVMGRAYGFEAKEDYYLESDGSQSIGIPFFNVNPILLGEDAYLVSYTGPGNTPVSSGNVQVDADFDLIGAEASLRVLLGRSGSSRIDLIGGYTYNRIKSSLTLATESVNLFTGDAIADGTVFNTNDSFATENEFNGAHLGVISSVTRKGVSLQTLAKISFGSMKQSSTISGFTTDSLGGSLNEGILTYASNSGTLTSDEFAFIPELGIKAGYDVSEALRLSVGYTFMYWSNVALAGDQVDRVIDPFQGVARPEARLVDGSFWVQGIDLGATLTF